MRDMVVHAPLLYFLRCPLSLCVLCLGGGKDRGVACEPHCDF